MGLNVYVGSGQLIEDATTEQVSRLKDALTFDNPKYLAAKKYSRNRYITIPPYLHFYHESRASVGGKPQPVIHVPRGFDVRDVLGGDVDFHWTNGGVGISYPDFLFTLRPAQERAFEAYRQEQKNALPRVFYAKGVVQLPTGMGKTVLALRIASYYKQRCIVLVHKNDLLEGWLKDIEKCFGGKVKPGVMGGGKRTLGSQVTIATVQTFNRLSEEEKESLYGAFGMVVLDECHHVGADIFNIVGNFSARYRLGLSATPQRSDGMDYVFGLFFGGICYRYEPSEGESDILPVRVVTKYSNATYRPFLHQGKVLCIEGFPSLGGILPNGDRWLKDIPYKERPAVPFLNIDSALVPSPRHLVPVCHDILSEYRRGKSCIAFFTQKEHVLRYFWYLRQFVPSEEIILYYGDSKEGDAEMIKRAEGRSALITLATYAKATEGTNVKAWEVAFLVSSINNEKNTIQAIGRIRRSAEGKISPVLVYDYRFLDAYSLSRHGFTREKVYHDLGFEYERHAPSQGITRGFKR